MIYFMIAALFIIMHFTNKNKIFSIRNPSQLCSYEPLLLSYRQGHLLHYNGTSIVLAVIMKEYISKLHILINLYI
jgi:hypothetical protein